jgi:Secretion system C-terminal sorting domain
MLISSNACGADTSTQVIDWEELTPVEASVHASVRVFPNPAKEILYLTGMPAGIRLLLVNALGQTVWQGESAGEKTVLEVSGLAEGLYWLRDDAGTFHTAVMVKR